MNTLSADFDLDRDGLFRSVRIEQAADRTQPTLRSHRIAIGLYARTGNTLQRVQRLEADISGPSTTIPELDGAPQPDLLLPNDDDLSYTKVRLDRRSLQTAVDHIDEVGSPLTRALLWNATWDMCRDAELPASEYMELVLRGVPTESDLTAVRSILGQAQSAANSYAPVPVRSRLLARWQSACASCSLIRPRVRIISSALARSFAAAAEDSSAAELIHGWLSGHRVPKALAIDPELRWTLVTNLARLGWLGRHRHLRRTGAGCDDHRRPAGRRRSCRTARGRGKGQCLAVGRRGRHDSQRDPERDLPWLLAARPGRIARSVHCSLLRGRRGDLLGFGHLGNPGHFHAEQRPALPVSLAGGEATRPSRA